MGIERPSVYFVQGPSRLPPPPKDRRTVAVLDVAFASAEGFDQVTDPFIRALGDRLTLWCDHHEHPMGWATYQGDPRFLLVPNRIAHACPELVTPDLARRIGVPDILFVHADLDGMLTAAKLIRGGVEAWPGADEDARAVDSPGRGHALGRQGETLAMAIDEALANFTAGQRRDFLKELLFALAAGRLEGALAEKVDSLASLSRQAQAKALELARNSGRLEASGVYVIRLEGGRRKGRERKTLLRYAEEQARIGVVIEVDRAQDHAWLTAATFDGDLDLGDVAGLSGGRSDFRGAEAHVSVDGVGFHEIIRRLGNLARN